MLQNPLVVFLVLLGISVTPRVAAQEIIELQRPALKVVTKDNSEPQGVTIYSDGGIITDAGIFLHANPLMGLYRVEKGKPNTIYDLTYEIQTSQSYTIFSPELSNYIVLNAVIGPTSVTMDGQGNGNFSLGFHILTSGTGEAYLETHYINDFKIILTER